MTSKGQQTQEKILTATLDLIERQGFHSTGLQQIIKASGAPKGSLYFHFPEGKDQIVVGALQQGANLMLAIIEQVFSVAADAAQALTWLFDGLARRLEDSQFEKGCPVATTALEAGSAHPTVADACRDAYARWTHALSTGLQRHGLNADQAEHEASLMLSMLEGALMLSKVQRATTPLNHARDAALARLTLTAS